MMLVLPYIQLVGVVPQAPLLFSGMSLRFNLDPWQQTRDEDCLLRALRDCRLAESLRASQRHGRRAEGGGGGGDGDEAGLRELLDRCLDEADSNAGGDSSNSREVASSSSTAGAATLTLSAGQRQLVSLGRAMLRGSCRLLLVSNCYVCKYVCMEDTFSLSNE